MNSVYRTIATIPEIIEAHTTTGDADLMLRVVARDTVDLHRIIQAVQSAQGVQRSNTSITTTEVVPHRMSPLLQQLAADNSQVGRPQMRCPRLDLNRTSCSASIS